MNRETGYERECRRGSAPGRRAFLGKNRLQSLRDYALDFVEKRPIFPALIIVLRGE